MKHYEISPTTKISLIVETKGVVYIKTHETFDDENDTEISNVLTCPLIEQAISTMTKSMSEDIEMDVFLEGKGHGNCRIPDKYEMITHMRNNVGIDHIEIEAAARAIFNEWAKHELHDATFDEIKSAGPDYKSLNDIYILSLKEGRAAIVAYLEEVLKTCHTFP